MVFIADWWSNTRLFVYCEEEVRTKYLGKEHVLLLMNHTYDIDWLIGWVLCEKLGVLGNCKAYAKKAIQYIPAIGWAWKFAEFVFLERSFDKDKEIIGKQVNEILDYPNPIWVRTKTFRIVIRSIEIKFFVLFCHLQLLLNAEGTRFTEKKHEASVKFAQERNMTVLKYHLIPRTKGFTASLPKLKEKCPCLLDVQLAFHKSERNAPTFSNLLHGRGVTAHMYIRRIDMKSLPDNETDAAEYVQEMFRRKDKLQESFHTHGDFFTGSGLTPFEPFEYKRTIGPFINTAVWMVVTLTPILYYLVALLFSGKLIPFFFGVAIISICKFIMTFF